MKEVTVIILYTSNFKHIDNVKFICLRGNMHTFYSLFIYLFIYFVVKPKMCLISRGGRVTPLSAVRCTLSVDQIGISVKSCPLMAEG